MQAAILPFPRGNFTVANNYIANFKSNIDIMIKRSMAKENGTVAVNQLPSLKLERDSYESKALCKLLNVNMELDIFFNFSSIAVFNKVTFNNI